MLSASIVLWAPSFAKIDARWLLTVLVLIFNAQAICFEAWPASTNSRISRSRDVRGRPLDPGARLLEPPGLDRLSEGELMG